MKPEQDITTGILGYFFKWEAGTPDAVFLRQPFGKRWKEYTWRETGIAARKLLAQIQQMQFMPGTKIGIWSNNCAEWIICDLALMMGGYISVPLYANVNSENLKGILLHAECELLFVGKIDLKVWESNKEAIPSKVQTLAMPGFQFENLVQQVHQTESSVPKPNIILPSFDDLLTIIYTSGTTGAPKGVMHTYGTTINAVLAAREMVMIDQPGNRFISYLPLSHAAERGLVEFGAIYSGGSISFVESAEQFSATMQVVQPTHFLAVPRVWQKFREGILEKVSSNKIEFMLRIPFVSSMLKKRILTTLGLQKAKIILTGAAPISVELLKWFHRLGIPIQEAYGLSEDFNVCSINPRTDIRIGTTGKLLSGQEVKILPDTHEIIQRSAWIMKGYFKDPELNAKAIQDGYFYTGEIGEIVDGYLVITGRVKDIFKTAKGEYIAPFPIETHFLSMDEIDQACVLGSRYPKPFIVVVLSKRGKEMDKDMLEGKLKAALDVYNRDSMGYQRLKKVIIVKDEWTTDNGILTLTMKMKRNVVAKLYEEKLENKYSTDETISWE